MKFRHAFIASMLMLSLSPYGLAAGKGATFQCWTNKQGVRECGNEVPPEYAQGETRTLNARGMTTNVEGRAKTQAEAEAELRAQQQKEAERQQQQAAAQNPGQPQTEQLSKEQQEYDRMLLASYLSEDDINAARTRKLTAIDAAITYNTGLLAKLDEKLKKAQERAATLQQSGKAPSADDQKDMASLQKQIDDKKVFIASKQKEKEDTNAEYDGYTKRFRELKAAKDAK